MNFKLIFIIFNIIQFARANNKQNKDNNDESPDIMMKTILTKLNTILKENAEINKRLDISDTHFQNFIDSENNFKNEYSNLVKEQNEIWQHQLQNSKSDWSVILRRQDGSVDFNRGWFDYKTGFGNPNEEFFIGLENLYTMTTYGDPQELFIVLRDLNNQTRYAQYDKFVVASELEKYMLKDLGNYTGNAGDSLRLHKEAKFSTKDEDNCKWNKTKHSEDFNGGWWFIEKQDCFLTGPYGANILWNKWLGNKTIQYVEVIIRSTIKQANQKLLNDVLDDNEKTSQNLMDISKRLEQQDNLLKNLLKSFNESLDFKSLNQNREWTVIQRRQDGSVNFYRNWNEYKRGFGNPNGEFFIGLEKLHALTTFGAPQELLVTLQDFDNQTRYAKYDNFVIGSEEEKYAIKELGNFKGDAGDSLIYHKGQKFTTFDKDNDGASKNCAESYKGAWWFNSCYQSHLNGPYSQISANGGINWNFWRGGRYSLMFVEMKIRSKL